MDARCEVLSDALQELGYTTNIRPGSSFGACSILAVKGKENAAHVRVNRDGLISFEDEVRPGELRRAFGRIGIGDYVMPEIEIKIPNMPRWKQIGGDMDPGQYGGTIARSHGDGIELLKIQPVREYVGDKEAAEVGHPFWTREAYFDLRDLNPSSEDVQHALDYVGINVNRLEADFTPEERGLVIAEALLDYGKADEGAAGWSADILSGTVEWSSGEVAGPEYLADEDEEFRREILGEDEEGED
jgi:hypothetical protein